ncbi:hypothetical protein D3C72_1923500 [compost metagenome]
MRPEALVSLKLSKSSRCEASACWFATAASADKAPAAAWADWRWRLASSLSTKS